MTLILLMISRMIHKQNKLPKDNGNCIELGKIASFSFRRL
jgi:hypothetical protein